MVEKIVGRDGGEAEQTLRACSVMRKFDAAMLAAVVGPEADLEQIKRYSFVEEATDPRDGFVRLHPVVRRELAQRLERTDQARFLELHARAAEHCAVVDRRAREGRGPRSGVAVLRVVVPLRGSELAGGEARMALPPGPRECRQQGRARAWPAPLLPRVFLDAFWWWGCYLDYAFCRTLVADWRRTQEDREWSESLQVFLDAYPGGYEKEKAPAEWRTGELPRWDAVRAALLEMREACGLVGDPKTLDASRGSTHARADRHVSRARRAVRTPDERRVRRRARALRRGRRPLRGRRRRRGTPRGRASSVPSCSSSTGTRDEAREDWTAAADARAPSSRTRSSRRTCTGSRPTRTLPPAISTRRSRRTVVRSCTRTSSSGGRTRRTSTRCRSTASRSRARSTGSCSTPRPAAT